MIIAVAIGQIGHVAGPQSNAAVLWVAVAVLAFAIGLVVVNASVIGGRHRLRTASRQCVAAVVAVTAVMSISAAPLAGGWQGVALPDLISDPPVASWQKTIIGDDGEARLVITFDGYIHNIGDGPLDVVGNPQEPGGMKQRAQTATGWEDVATPTVRYETDDGHNHFHLIEAVDYLLWNGRTGEQTEFGSKIGFCLVDSERVESSAEPAYSEELDNFCQEDNPDATELRMGISTGWRDVYDSTTTLQWVDISEVPPGQYWLGAITDANDEIRESNETNNDLVFSEQPIIVSGYEAIASSITADGSEPITIDLAAQAWGTVGMPVFTVLDAPANGWLSTETDMATTASTLTWRPDAGFTGTETLRYSVRDLSSAFPIEASEATIEITVDMPTTIEPLVGAGPRGRAETTFLDAVVGTRAELDISATPGTAEEPPLFSAVGFPPGVALDSRTGAFVGAPLKSGVYDGEVVVSDAYGKSRLPLSWIVEDRPAGGSLHEGVDLSSPALTALQIRVGSSGLGITYAAQGLPAGLEIDPIAPLISGTPSETGAFDVSVTATDRDGATSTRSFRWTIRATAVPSFPL